MSKIDSSLGDAREALYYRLYFMDSSQSLGGISSVHEFHAADDAVAIRIAEAWREGRPTELWCRDRMVKAWP